MEPTPAAGAELRRNDDARRYELVEDGRVIAIASFHDAGALTTVPHTEVLASRRGNGIGAVLVGGVLDDLRRRGQRIVPACWYVAQFLREHPEYADLRA